MNEGQWIKVTSSQTGRKIAVNLQHLVAVHENHHNDVSNGRKAKLQFTDGVFVDVLESFDEIGAMIR